MGKNRVECSGCKKPFCKSKLDKGVCKTCSTEKSVVLKANFAEILKSSRISKIQNLSKSDIERIANSGDAVLQGDIRAIFDIYNKCGWNKDTLMKDKEFGVFVRRCAREIFDAEEYKQTLNKDIEDKSESFNTLSSRFNGLIKGKSFDANRVLGLLSKLLESNKDLRSAILGLIRRAEEEYGYLSRIVNGGFDATLCAEPFRGLNALINQDIDVLWYGNRKLVSADIGRMERSARRAWKKKFSYVGKNFEALRDKERLGKLWRTRNALKEATNKRGNFSTEDIVEFLKKNKTFGKTQYLNGASGKDGVVLPKKGEPYFEWDATFHKASHTGKRDAERFIRGKNGVVYYTCGHYNSAVLITKSKNYPAKIMKKG